LFIRSEECQEYDAGKARIAVPAHAAKYAETELHWLEVCSAAIKAKYPALQFKILKLSYSAEAPAADTENNIVTIPCPMCDYRCKSVGTDMKNLIDEHAEYLTQNL